MARVLALVVGLLGTLVGAGAAPAAPTRIALDVNGGFEHGLAGWKAWGSARLVDGRESVFAAHLAAHVDGYSPGLKLAAPPTSVAGDSYEAAAWVAAASPVRVCVSVREERPTGPYSRSSCTTAGAGWTRVTTYPLKAAGGVPLDVRVFATESLPLGAGLTVDDVELTRTIPDTTAPETTILSGPPAETTESEVTFTFTADEPAQFLCSIDGGEFVPNCESPKHVGAIEPGVHTFRVMAMDGAENFDPTPAEWTWTKLAPPPPPPPPAVERDVELVVNGGFEGSTSGWSGYHASVALSGDAHWASGAAHVSVTTAGGAYAINPSAKQVQNATIPQGDVFKGSGAVKAPAGKKLCLRIREYDDRRSLLGAAASCATSTGDWQLLTVQYAGRGGRSLDFYAYQSTSSVAGDWFLVDGLSLRDLGPAPADADMTPPETAITGGPSGTVTDRTATFEFTSTEPGRFECFVDGVERTSCTSPLTLTDLAVGEHVFAVRAVDTAGNADPTAERRTWYVAEAAPPPSTWNGGLLPNGSFESTLDGWWGFNAELTRVTGAVPDGGFAVRVAKLPGAYDYGLGVEPKPVAATVAGATYTALGSFRADRPGTRICLRIREYTPSHTLAGTAQTCTELTGEWQQLTVSYAAVGGNALDVFVIEDASPSPDGAGFDADALRLTQP